MEILIKVSQFILSLSLIIVLHEFGHYWPARYFKIKVEKFYLFFDVNFSLFKKILGRPTEPLICVFSALSHSRELRIEQIDTLYQTVLRKIVLMKNQCSISLVSSLSVTKIIK